MERILSLLGLAHKAGRVEIGEEPVGSAARAKKARIILVAGDAAASSVRRAMGFANAGSCLCLVIPATKEQLGRAVTDIGFADAVTGKLAALDPEKFQSAAQRMTVKAQRARERRQEQLAHEKNVRMGKKRLPKPPERKAPTDKNMPPEQEARPGKGKRKPARPGSKERGAAARTQKKNQARTRFQGSKPVKKGKGSGRKNP